MISAIKPVARPVVLLILDGFGCREDAPDNAISRARMPKWDRLLASCPHTSIDASELEVGLPAGQMGNSEVGHLNIGAGRIVYQDFTRIDHAIATGEFARNPVLTDAVAVAKASGAAIHVMGPPRPAAHSHERQIAAMVELAAAPARRHPRPHLRRPRLAAQKRGSVARILSGVCASSPARIASICGAIRDGPASVGIAPPTIFWSTAAPRIRRSIAKPR
jgi:hypothetical protein